MQKYLATRRGARVVLVVSMGANRTLQHYYQGTITAVGDGVVMIKDEGMDDVAVSCERVIAVKTLSEPPAQQPESSQFEIER
jgi:hypothetical protein